MGLWDMLTGRRAAGSAPTERGQGPLMASGSVESPTQWRGLMLPGGPSSAGIRVDEAAALTVPATIAALRILSGVFAMTPMHYYERQADGRRRADDSALWELMYQRPNNHQSAFQFRELMMADLLLAGNFFAYVSRDLAGRPVALTRLNPARVVIAEFFSRSEGTELFYDAVLPDATAERFSRREIWHVAGFSRNGLQGLSPVAMAREALGGAIATSRHAARFWSTGGRPSTVLTTEQEVTAEQKTQIRQDWMERFGGPDGDAVAVLSHDLKPEFLNHNMQESQFLETRGFQVVDLCRVWGVPPHLIFDLTRATFSNIEHQSLEFVTFHMGPHYERVAQGATNQFADPGFYFEHNTDALTKGDLKSRMEAYWLQRQMGIANADELRRRDNEAPIGGAAGQEYWRPGNMGVAGEPMAQPMPPAAAPAEPAAAGVEQLEAKIDALAGRMDGMAQVMAAPRETRFVRDDKTGLVAGSVSEIVK